MDHVGRNRKLFFFHDLVSVGSIIFSGAEDLEEVFILWPRSLGSCNLEGIPVLVVVDF